jgi:subtilisin family serine protease
MSDLPTRGRPVTHLRMERLEDRTNPDATFAEGQILLGLTPGVETSTFAFLNNSGLTTGYRHIGFGVYKVTLQPGVSVQQAISTFNGRNGVRYAEPDYRISLDAVPNDPSFTDGSLWGQHNTGQNGGVAGADFDGPEGWDNGTGTRQNIVAVFDDGVEHTHPDLAANMWVNTGETPGDGVDNDGNGYVDDINGFNFVSMNANIDPEAGDGHGTHVAGTIGAVGNNGIGVNGVIWNTRIMAVKIYGASGVNPGGLVSGVVEGYNYAIANGAKVLNNSWKYYGARSDAFMAAIDATRANGMIVVASAGNDGMDNETYDRWPSNFTLFSDNVVAVAALDRNDQKASFSNFSDTMVQIGAPGVEILSTYAGGGYEYLDGTSMAAPQVSGALILAWDISPTATYRELIDAMNEGAVPIQALNGLTVTGGRLNIPNLLNNLSTTTYATGAGVGGGPAVNVYRGTSSRPLVSFFAYDAGFTGGVRVASADVNGDGITDIVAVPGKGGGPNVRVFDGKTFQIVYDFQAFEPEFTGGLFVASRDMDNDGWAEIVVSADRDGGPRVTVFKPNPLNGGAIETLANFFAYDIGFTGGVRIAIGDLDGDGKADLITAPGLGGGPNVRAYSGAEIALGNVVLTHDALAGNIENRNGLFIAADDLTGDGIAEVIVGSGAGTPVVRVYNGLTFDLHRQFSAAGGPIPGLVLDQDTNLDGTLVNPGFPLNLIPPAVPANQLPVISGTETPRSLNGYQYGIRVATHDVNRDGIADIVLGAGPTDQPKVALMNGSTFAEMRNFQAYANFFYGGVFVGGAGAEPEA